MKSEKSVTYDVKKCKKILPIITIIVVATVLTSILLYSLFIEKSMPQGRTIIDMTGRRVVIPYEVKRAVVFAEYTLVYALGAWDDVVGVSKYAKYNEIMINTVKGLDNYCLNGSAMSFNVEEVLSKKPDIVLTYGGNGGYATPQNLIDQLESAGVPVVLVNIYNVSDVYRCISMYGEIFNKQERAQQIISEMKSTFDMVNEKVQGLQRVRVLHTWTSPTKVTGGLGITHDLIVNAGGVDVAESLHQRYATVDMEQIIEWNPDVVLIWGYASYSPSDLYNDSQWSTINAVKNKSIYKYPKISTWAPEVAILQLWFGTKIHPDVFKNIDIQEYADNFFLKIYGIKSPFKWT